MGILPRRLGPRGAAVPGMQAGRGAHEAASGEKREVREGAWEVGPGEAPRPQPPSVCSLQTGVSFRPLEPQSPLLGPTKLGEGSAHCRVAKTPSPRLPLTATLPNPHLFFGRALHLQR